MEDTNQSLGATINLTRNDLQLDKKNKNANDITLDDFKASKLNRWQIRNAHYIVFINNGKHHKLKGIGLEMSELKKRQFPINYEFDWEFGVTISAIRKDLDAIEKLGGTWIDINKNHHYGDVELEFRAIENRFETQVEYDERIAEDKSKLDRIKTNELNQLKILKGKYEIN